MQVFVITSQIYSLEQIHPIPFPNVLEVEFGIADDPQATHIFLISSQNLEEEQAQV